MKRKQKTDFVINVNKWRKFIIKKCMQTAFAQNKTPSSVQKRQRIFIITC